MDVPEDFRRRFVEFAQAAQSPLERCLLGATLDPESGLVPKGVTRSGLEYRLEFTDSDSFVARDQRIEILSQVDPIGNRERPRIHCDFGFTWLSSPGARLYVELDGHDWHERTKEQASRDRARDRRVLRSGSQVIRYTGSDMYRDPVGVVRDITDTLSAVVDNIDLWIAVTNSRRVA